MSYTDAYLNQHRAVTERSDAFEQFPNERMGFVQGGCRVVCRPGGCLTCLDLAPGGQRCGLLWRWTRPWWTTVKIDTLAPRPHRSVVGATPKIFPTFLKRSFYGL